MKILTLGSDNNIFKEGSSSQDRALEYAKLVNKYIVIVPAEQDRELKITDDVLALGVKRALGPLTLIRMYRKAKHIIHTYDIDIVSAQNPFEYALIGYFLKLTCKVKLHIQEHGDFFTTNHWRNEKLLHRFRFTIGKLLLKKADSVRAVSQKIKDTLLRMGVHEKQITVVPVFVPLHMQSNKKRELARRCLCVIRFVKQKNPLMLVHAWAKVIEQVSDAKLVIVGKGELEKDMNTQIQALGLGQSIEIKSWADDLSSCYSQSDIHVLSSNYEGWGRVVIEAATYGVPTVMTDVGCAREFLVDGKNGRVVSIEDQEGFANAIINIMKDDKQYQSLQAGIQSQLDALPSKKETLRLYKQSWDQAFL